MIRVFQYYISARKLLLVLTETLLLFIVFAFGGSFQFSPLGIEQSAILSASSSAILAAVLCQIVLVFQDMYDWRISIKSSERHPRLLAACAISFVLLAAVFFWFQLTLPGFAFGIAGEEMRTRTWRFILTIICAFLTIGAWRAVFHAFFGKWGLAERVLILGSGDLALSLAREISERHDCGYEVAGLVPGKNEESHKLRRRDPEVAIIDRSAADLFDIARDMRAQRVIVALQDRRQALPVEQLLKCRLSGIQIEERERLYERITGKIAVEALRPSYLIFNDGFKTSPLRVATKRVLDLVASAIGLVLSSPILLLTAIAIKLDSRGPVFYTQERVGQDGDSFVLYKFRSMRTDAEKHGPVWASQDDARVTRVGKFIRRVRIDEIPQMWNVLRGEMSFVGPRPERPVFTEELAKEIPYFLERLCVKPGLTGWAQVCYPYGNTRADAIQKLQYDLYYIKNMSVIFDLAVILQTVKVVMLRRGAM
ncbi:MAG: TIGR03013 family XrtA/PEP-CTERM system glycosyltransferase [Planctomycetota bacterium]